MIKKTFKTISHHPSVFIGLFIDFFAIYIVSEDFSDISQVIYMKFDVLLNEIFTSIPMLAVVFLFLLPFATFTYDKIMNNNSADWFRRGIKNTWYQLLIFTVVLWALCTALYKFVYLNLIPQPQPARDIILYSAFAIMILMALVYMISFAALAAEKKFSDVIKGTFTVGRKYYLKLTILAVAFAAISIAVYYFSLKLTDIINDSQISALAKKISSLSEDEQVRMLVDKMEKLSDARKALKDLILPLVPSAFAAFLYIYSMVSYIDIKSKTETSKIKSD